MFSPNLPEYLSSPLFEISDPVFNVDSFECTSILSE